MILWVFIALLYYHLLLQQPLYYLFSSANKLCSGQNHQMERCNFMSFAVAERLNVQAEGCKFSWYVFLPLVLASYWTAERNIDLREKSYCSPPISLFVKTGGTRPVWKCICLFFSFFFLHYEECAHHIHPSKYFFVIPILCFSRLLFCLW